MDTLVYMAHIAPLKDPVLYRLALELASSQRREKTLRLRLAADRERSLAAELLLRCALAEQGTEPAELRYAFGPEQKPRLEGQEGLCFNLSHSGDCVLCVLGEHELGCDVQKLQPVDPALVRRFFAPEEQAQITAAEGEERAQLTIRFWTWKESYIKAVGRGLRQPLGSFAIRPGPEGPQLVRPEGGRPCFFAELAAPDGYCAALCQLDAPPRLRQRSVDLGAFLSAELKK